jgi:hypothetical protein
MRYAEYRDAIRKALRQNPDGLSWIELRNRLDLPYNRPCPEWTNQLEQEIGLRRLKTRGRALRWTLSRRSPVA